MKIDREILRDLGARYTEAWCGQEPGRVAAFFSEEGSLSINGGAPAVGRNAIREVAARFMIAFPDLVLTMDDVRGMPDEDDDGDRCLPLDFRRHQYGSRRWGKSGVV
jgi:hypothetical protein